MDLFNDYIDDGVGDNNDDYLMMAIVIRIVIVKELLYVNDKVNMKITPITIIIITPVMIMKILVDGVMITVGYSYYC